MTQLQILLNNLKKCEEELKKPINKTYKETIKREIKKIELRINNLKQGKK